MKQNKKKKEERNCITRSQRTPIVSIELAQERVQLIMVLEIRQL